MMSICLLLGISISIASYDDSVMVWYGMVWYGMLYVVSDVYLFDHIETCKHSQSVQVSCVRVIWLL